METKTRNFWNMYLIIIKIQLRVIKLNVAFFPNHHSGSDYGL